MIELSADYTELLQDELPLIHRQLEIVEDDVEGLDHIKVYIKTIYVERFMDVFHF